jgi:hypothetical protein
MRSTVESAHDFNPKGKRIRLMHAKHTKNQAFQELLQNLVQSQQCSEAILCTRAGSVVGYSRAEAAAPHGVASISASLSTAVSKLSFLLGENEVDLILQRGSQKCIALSGMPGDMVLVSVHNPEESESAMRQTSDELAERLLQLHPRSLSGPAAISEELLLEANAALDEIFGLAA